MASSFAQRWITRSAILAVLVFTCYLAMETNVFGSLPWPEGIVDYQIFYDASRAIAQTNVYPDKHAYPPSAIALHYLLALIPFAWSAAVFMALTILATMACWWLLLRFFPGGDRLGWLVLVLPAYKLSQHYIQWDLKSQNCNMIFCVSVLAGVYCLHRERPSAAGFWLALSFSLKLFSVLLIPYLLWRGNVRAFAWLLAFVALLWFALPLGVFGGTGLIATYREWLRTLHDVGTTRTDLAHPILISLHNAAHRLFQGDDTAVAWLVNGFWAAWLVVGVGAAVAAFRWRAAGTDAYGLLAYVGLLLLGPIAVSPYLEPYHPVPFIIPAFLLAEAATDRRQNARLRIFAAVMFCAVFLLRPAIAPFAYRALPVNLALLLATAATVSIAWSRRIEPLPSVPGGPGASVNDAGADKFAKSPHQITAVSSCC